MCVCVCVAPLPPLSLPLSFPTVTFSVASPATPCHRHPATASLISFPPPPHPPPPPPTPFLHQLFVSLSVTLVVPRPSVRPTILLQRASCPPPVTHLVVSHCLRYHSPPPPCSVVAYPIYVRVFPSVSFASHLPPHCSPTRRVAVCPVLTRTAPTTLLRVLPHHRHVQGASARPLLLLAPNHPVSRARSLPTTLTFQLPPHTSTFLQPPVHALHPQSQSCLAPPFLRVLRLRGSLVLPSAFSLVLRFLYFPPSPTPYSSCPPTPSVSIL